MCALKEIMARKMLLLSNSRNYGSQYLEHCKEAVTNFFGRCNVTRLLFIPYALSDHDAYAKQIRNAFNELGIAVDSLHEFDDPIEKIRTSQGLFIGGGNTFLLLKTLHDQSLIDPIRKRVLDDGIPYLGTSAGTNVATVSICTTNDMPIVHPPSFLALGLVPFNINPHYMDPDPTSHHMGETREVRIAQYQEIPNMPPVLGLREGSWLEIDGDSMILKGERAARLFVSGKSPQEHEIGSELSFLLAL